jgi:hypothetical protein
LKFWVKVTPVFDSSVRVVVLLDDDAAGLPLLPQAAIPTVMAEARASPVTTFRSIL